MPKKSEEPRDAGPTAAAFERDFGYLGKFLAGLGEHASSFEGARRERFLQLLAGLPERFAEIRAMLGGSQASAPSAAQDSPTAPPRADRSARSDRPSPPTGLTVGSLIRSQQNVDS